MKVHNAITHDRIQDQSFWADFKEGAGRRNRAVHSGEKVSAEQGAKACDVAQKVLDHLDSVISNIKSQ